MDLSGWCGEAGSEVSSDSESSSGEAERVQRRDPYRINSRVADWNLSGRSRSQETKIFWRKSSSPAKVRACPSWSLVRRVGVAGHFRGVWEEEEEGRREREGVQEKRSARRERVVR